MLWWSNVLQHGDGARQISTPSLTHVSFPVKWIGPPITLSPERTIRCDAGAGLGRLPRHVNRLLRLTESGRYRRWSQDLFRRLLLTGHAMFRG